MYVYSLLKKYRFCLIKLYVVFVFIIFFLNTIGFFFISFSIFKFVSEFSLACCLRNCLVQFYSLSFTSFQISSFFNGKKKIKWKKKIKTNILLDNRQRIFSFEFSLGVFSLSLFFSLHIFITAEMFIACSYFLVLQKCLKTYHQITFSSLWHLLHDIVSICSM